MCCQETEECKQLLMEPVTVGVINYSRKGECGLFCKFTETFLFLFLEVIHTLIHMFPCKEVCVAYFVSGYR